MSYKRYHKIQTAVALQYEKVKDEAPKIVASGQGELASKIIAIAKANNIPIQEHEELIDILSLVEINSHIPVEAYSAVAEILSLIYNNNNGKR